MVCGFTLSTDCCRPRVDCVGDVCVCVCLGCFQLDLDTCAVQYSNTLPFRQIDAKNLEGHLCGHFAPLLAVYDRYAPGLDLLIYHDVEPATAVKECEGMLASLWFSLVSSRF